LNRLIYVQQVDVWWKRYLTLAQITQFVLALFIILPPLLVRTTAEFITAVISMPRVHLLATI